MNVISFRERRALTLHNRMQGMPILDPTNHLQRLAAGSSSREVARQYLDQIKQSCAPSAPVAGRNAPELANSLSWHKTPELYRKMIARAAGLGPDVVAKLDRDLTETDKAMLRSAARDLRDCLNSLVNI